MDEEASTATATVRTYEQVLLDAIGVLTQAARLRGPASDRVDWAEFVTRALAGAAANIGGVDAVLAGRAGSWEADAIRDLITSTVGHDPGDLMAHRTEPILVEVFVSEILNDLGVWGQYDQAAQSLVARAQAIDPAAPDQEQQLDVIAEQEKRLELERDRTWAAYGGALKAHIQAAATTRPGLIVPVEIRVDVDTFRPSSNPVSEWGLADDLLQEAVAEVSIPVLTPPGPPRPLCGG